MMPKARKDELVVQELPGETLVYDLKRHKAHCLNRTAGVVWRHCDGYTTVQEITEILKKKVKIPADERVVWLALDRLSKAHLLWERVTPPAGVPRCSRRELARRLGLIGGLSILLPVVMSIVAPTAVQAVSACDRARCRTGNINPGDNCAGCLGGECTDRPGRFCQWDPVRGTCDCL